jgi:ABC-type polysaccharide/polyol phosphate export permease
MELWRYGELFHLLALRELPVRYKRTAIGVIWVLVRPLITMLIFTIVFGRIVRLPADGSAPYSLMVFAAILPSTSFATGLAAAANSLVISANQGLFAQNYRANGHGNSTAFLVSYQGVFEKDDIRSRCLRQLSGSSC